MFDDYSLRNDMRAEMMQAYGKVLGPRSSLMVGGNFNTTAIILEHGTMNFWCCEIQIEPALLKLLHQVHDPNHFT